MTLSDSLLRQPPARLRTPGALVLALLLSLAMGVACAAPPGDRNAASAATDAADGVSLARMRLVSQQQYFNSIAYVFGPDVSVSTHFSPFQRTDGLLASGAATAGITLGQMQEFQRTAGALAETIVSPAYRNFLIPCSPAHESAADAACAARFLIPVARLLQRRPLSEAQRTHLVTQAGAAADRLHNFYAGLAVALEGLFISPDTLFMIERTEPDPERPGHHRLEAYSLASRLSFFLWNAAPDEELLEAARSGALHTQRGLSAAVDRLLESPRLETGVRAFFDDMLRFDDFAVLAKDARIYPAFSGETVEDAREQTLRTLIDHLLVRHRDYRDLFTTRDSFMSPSLAVIYGVSAPPGWTEWEMPQDSARVGLLTQVSFLAAHAHPGRSSPTLRGKALRELLLCQKVPRPPPNVDFSIVEDPNSSLLTARERLAAHRSNPICAGCHKVTDPIGLALENFDGAGQYRATERGAPIDASGVLDGKAFADAAGLAAALHDNPALPACLVTRVYSYGLGGPTRADDKAILAALKARFAQQGYRLPDLLRSVALSSAFRMVKEPPTLAAPVAMTVASRNTRLSGTATGESQ